MRRPTIVLALLVCFVMLAAQKPIVSAEEKTFKSYCAEEFAKSGVCSKDLCRAVCADGSEKKDCPKACVPQDCPKIPLEKCPRQFCEVMTNCSNEQVCHYKMPGEPAQCGDLAYAGQDVKCCPGLVQRCGIEFIDGNCDMEGRNSVYDLPICIPCGNKICDQFENRCNCPEDCGTPPDIPLVDEFLTVPGMGGGR